MAVHIIRDATVGCPYVGIAEKHDGDYNAVINAQTPIFHLVVNCTSSKFLSVVALSL